MDSLKKNKVTPTIASPKISEIENMVMNQECSNPSCFFCIMKEPDPSLRRAGIASCFKKMPLIGHDQEHVLVLSGLWNISMTQPDDPEFPLLGIFDCMTSFIHKAINDRSWLLRDQNIYIPYYAAHVIGSYTMNKVEFAEQAVLSGVMPPLMELLRGKISWVEQRVAVRALGHLASYEKTFEAISQYEEEVVRLAMHLACTALDEVYVKFVGVDKGKRLKYQCDLLTRGVGGSEMENGKAEEWASQLQCWSLYLLNCFACKGRCLNLICKQEFLTELCRMWGGLVNHSSPAGVGLMRILCYTKYGRKSISESKDVLENLCHLSRSSDDWQYMGIDCLILLLKDLDTRYNVLEIVAMFLIDLTELKTLGDRLRLGEVITRTLLLDYKQRNSRIKNIEARKAIQETWELKVERRKRENFVMSEEKVEERKVLANLIKQQANHMFWLGDVEAAIKSYTEALDTCPLKLRKERMVLYSSRAHCYLLLRNPDAAIRDSTRALCLSNPPNSHAKSLWRRSQAYDMKGLAKESLMDCIMFINGCIKSESKKRVKIPYYAARMISKQMDATWLFANAQSKAMINHMSKKHESDVDYEISSNGEQEYRDEMIMKMMMMEKKSIASGLSTIIEEPLMAKERKLREMKREARRTKVVRCRSSMDVKTK